MFAVIALFTFGHIVGPEETSQVSHIEYNEIADSETWNEVD